MSRWRLRGRSRLCTGPIWSGSCAPCGWRARSRRRRSPGRTGLSAATVSNIVRELKDGGTVEVTPTSAGGRRARSVSLSGDAGIVIGVDFGHTHLRVAVGNLAHQVLAEEAEPLDVDASAAQGFDRAEQLVNRLIAATGIGPDKVIGVGLGVPGPDRRGVRDARLHRDPAGLDRHQPRARSWPGASACPCTSTTTPTSAPSASWSGAAAAGVRDLAYIKVASGVGAGLVINGQIYRGPGGTAGEIGHITLDESGPVCRCGNRGCLETFTAARYVLPLLQSSHGTDLTMERVVQLAREGDPGCRRVIADVGRHIGSGVANLCNLLNPSRVVLGGDLAEAGELVLGPIRESVGAVRDPQRGTAAVRSLPGGARRAGGGARARWRSLLSEMGDSTLLRRQPRTAPSAGSTPAFT